MTISLLLAACAMEAAQLDTEALTDAEVGRQAVDFTLEGHDGRDVVLSEHAGDVILLDMSGFY